jgi:hypothetical protein
MPTEIMHPAPLWQRGFYHAEWAHLRTGFNQARTMFPAFTSFGIFMASLYAYADRRCLYIYQKHDPRTVYLPWEKDFIAKHAH